MEENYVHHNKDSAVTVRTSSSQADRPPPSPFFCSLPKVLMPGSHATISRNFLNFNGWEGVRVYDGATAKVEDNELIGNTTGVLLTDSFVTVQPIYVDSKESNALELAHNSVGEDSKSVCLLSPQSIKKTFAFKSLLESVSPVRRLEVAM
jgi:hypothetical protein